jgi:hypothetical protein
MGPPCLGRNVLLMPLSLSLLLDNFTKGKSLGGKLLLGSTKNVTGVIFGIASLVVSHCKWKT